MKKRLILLFLAGVLVGFGVLELQRAASHCAESKPEVPETAVLLEVSMTRTTSSADDSFRFTADSPRWDTEAGGHFLSCEYRAENGELFRRRDAPLTDVQWAQLETLVRALDLASCEAPDERLLDAPNSDVAITWTDGGICQLIAGIVGVKHSRSGENSGKCVTWGIAVIAFTVLGAILNTLNSAKFDVGSIVTGLVLPALYIYGAIPNSRADDTQTAA